MRDIAMIYVTSTTTTTNFPRILQDNYSTYTVTCTNMVTKATITLSSLTNSSTKSYYYTFDLSAYTSLFSDGQYEYTIKDGESNVLTSGILQFGDFTTTKTTYSGQTTTYVTYKR